ncbi:MAG: hypothetical protein Kow0089_19400 [Desulfobulbaceae bacterium]
MGPFRETLKDIYHYARSSGKVVIALLIVFFLLLGAVIVLTEGTAVMPFIYTIF